MPAGIIRFMIDNYWLMLLTC